MHRGPSSKRWLNLRGRAYCVFVGRSRKCESVYGFSDVWQSLHVNREWGRFQPGQISQIGPRYHTPGKNVVTVVRFRDHDGAIAEGPSFAEPVVTTFSAGDLGDESRQHGSQALKPIVSCPARTGHRNGVDRCVSVTVCGDTRTQRGNRRCFAKATAGLRPTRGGLNPGHYSLFCRHFEQWHVVCVFSPEQ